MDYLVTAKEMRRYDAYTIEKIGIPGMVLMERAALSARDHIVKWWENNARGAGPGRILVMAGTGNNGGDGLALARLLSEAGFLVDVWRVGDEEKASAQWRQQRGILSNYAVELSDNLPDREYIILVDALFGVGISREITGRYAEAISLFNQKSGYKLALDMPSGIDCDTGSILGRAVKADMTVTFGFAKRGLYLYPGAEFAGAVQVADVGIVMDPGEKPGMLCISSARGILPGRDPAGNKGSFGKVLLIAGAKGMAGAAVLAAKAAYRSGAGMVKVLTAPENRVILQATVPEALYGAPDSLQRDLEWADVIAIGPGLGREAEAGRILKQVISDSGKPLVIDADGLNLLAEDTMMRDALASREGGRILTPHVGELARMSGKTTAELKERLWEHGRELAEELHAVIVAKDARTFICCEGMETCVNVTGNSGMATAGSGDVLTGVIAGIYAQLAKSGAMETNPDPDIQMAYRAACCGVAVHAAAGQKAVMQKGEYACMAGDIADAVADATSTEGNRSWR